MKKAAVLGCAALLALALGIFFIVHQRPGIEYNASMAIACDGQAYEEQDGVGYLSFTTGASGAAVAKRIQVRDAAVMQALSAIDASEVIGVNLTVSIPAEDVARHHLDVKSLDCFQLLADGVWDDCFSVIGISVP